MSREILFEIKVSGAFAKVSAIDALTGIEATMVGPASAGAAALRQAALRKLERLLEKQGNSR